MQDHLIPGNYVAIPEKTLLSSEWKDLAATTKCTYTAMLTKYFRTGPKSNGRVMWAQIELSDATGISLRTIRKCIDELLDKEWIWIWEPGGRWAKGTTYEVNPIYADGQSPKPTK